MRSIQRGDQYAEQKYFSIYRALVVNNKDPKKLGRLILSVPELFGVDLKTDWATPKTGYLSAGNKSANNPQAPADEAVLNTNRQGDKGDFFVPDIGDGVYVEFESGDPCRPLWSGRWWAEPGGGSEVPMLAREIADESQVASKGTDSMITATGITLNEPPISFEPTYPNNRSLKTKSGIVIELDDTEGNERIHIWHPKRTWKEVHPDGSVTEHVQVRRYVYIEADDDKHVKGNWNVHVVGDCTLHVEGDFIRHIEGDEVSIIDGNKTETVGGFKHSLVAGPITAVSEDRVDEYAPELRRHGDHIGDYATRIDHNGPGDGPPTPP